ncbi:hypothetical protein CDL15_Pgr001015 [Punica granatum]|uniref:Uncharacterized protein n=1 Tax=Punica granatum TaxID=22663 RepID=A0A218VSY6_PUNGR|nr:hypothetical protein CDL15_Pgr001015 [Punica granatum]
MSPRLGHFMQRLRTRSASRGAMVVVEERQCEEVPCPCNLYMPSSDWTVMKDTSIEEFGVPSQLLEFIYLPKDKQQKRDFLGLPRTEAVDTLLRDEIRVLHGRYES